MKHSPSWKRMTSINPTHFVMIESKAYYHGDDIPNAPASKTKRGHTLVQQSKIPVSYPVIAPTYTPIATCRKGIIYQRWQYHYHNLPCHFHYALPIQNRDICLPAKKPQEKDNGVRACYTNLPLSLQPPVIFHAACACNRAHLTARAPAWRHRKMHVVSSQPTTHHPEIISARYDAQGRRVGGLCRDIGRCCFF